MSQGSRQSGSYKAGSNGLANADTMKRKLQPQQQQPHDVGQQTQLLLRTPVKEHTHLACTHSSLVATTTGVRLVRFGVPDGAFTDGRS